MGIRARRKGMAHICPACHQNLDVIGRLHICAPLPSVNGKASKTSDEDRKEMARLSERSLGVPDKKENSTYRGRDKEKRRKYMQEYMLKKSR